MATNFQPTSFCRTREFARAQFFCSLESAALNVTQVYHPVVLVSPIAPQTAPFIFTLPQFASGKYVRIQWLVSAVAQIKNTAAAPVDVRQVIHIDHLLANGASGSGIQLLNGEAYPLTNRRSDQVNYYNVPGLRTISIDNFFLGAAFESSAFTGPVFFTPDPAGTPHKVELKVCLNVDIFTSEKYV